MVAKLLLDDDEFGRVKLDHEIGVYRAFTREICTHRELPDGPLRDERLPLIETLWAHARKRLQTLVREGRR